MDNKQITFMVIELVYLSTSAFFLWYLSRKKAATKKASCEQRPFTQKEILLAKLEFFFFEAVREGVQGWNLIGLQTLCHKKHPLMKVAIDYDPLSEINHLVVWVGKDKFEKELPNYLKLLFKVEQLLELKKQAEEDARLERLYFGTIN